MSAALGPTTVARYNMTKQALLLYSNRHSESSKCSAPYLSLYIILSPYTKGKTLYSRSGSSVQQGRWLATPPASPNFDVQWRRGCPPLAYTLGRPTHGATGVCSFSAQRPVLYYALLKA